MHDHLRHLIIGFSLVSSACDVEEDFELEQPELGQPTEHNSIDEVATASQGELRLMEGLDADCIDVRGPIITRIDPDVTTCKFDGFEEDFEDKWVTTSLFESGSPMLDNLGDVIPANSPLREFCRYNYIGDGVDLHGDYTDLMAYIRGQNGPNGVDAGSAAIDCPVIAPMTDEGLDTYNGRTALHEAFMANLNAVSADDLDKVPRRRMRLALLDTVARGWEPANEHGLLLANLIADIACPGDPYTCLDWIEHVLVTPRIPGDHYRTADWHGGLVGYMHEFSMGLAFALLDWSGPNLALPANERQRLVVSAAVGADPNHPIASDPAYAPAQSAIVALQAAYCMGAVVYAAAGNTTDNSCGSQETQMLAPASYETFVAPTTGECLSWGYTADDPFYTFVPGSPLIHAVGGLTGGDTPIPNHRRQAHPRLHATASDAISEKGEVAITGTSVATAAVAGATLLRWSIDPEMSGSAVAQHLYDEGSMLSVNADDGRYVGQPIRRLAICHALEDLIDVDCGPLTADPHGNLDEYTLSIEDAIAEAQANDLLLGSGVVKPDGQPDCSAGPEFDIFVRPQPERPACSNCNGVLNPAGNTHTLNMSIAMQSWTTDLDVVGAYLFTFNAAGQPTVFNLSTVVDEINEAIPANIIQVPFTVAAPASAVLELRYVDSAGTPSKQSNAIPLLWPV
jgi:hypothetical protein